MYNMFANKRCFPQQIVRGVQMTQDQSEQVEELLIQWHRYQDMYSPAVGFPRCDPTCRDYQIPGRLTDAERSAMSEAKIWKHRSEQVDLCVDKLHWEQRAAIQVSMKNKRCGFSVWNNPRISQEDSHRHYQEAKTLLYPMLVSRGLIKQELQVA
jgi:hypothetical protein